MIVIRLREAMERYEAQTGERLTYEELAVRADLSSATLYSMATRRGYNASLRTLEKICKSLRCSPGELLEFEEGQDERH